LPGVIDQAEVPEEEYLVKLVASLVKTYIQTDNCLNLLALPMTDDTANSTTSKLVLEFKAQDRTIGVLTKPDRIRTSLPQITERVRSKPAEVIARLKQLPEPPKGNLSLKIYEKILAFESEMRKTS
ncbi:MAG: hypothetical protein LQ341_006748, partial [Variospora aurantia]